MPNFLIFSIFVGLALSLVTLINTDFGLIMLIFSMLLSPQFQLGAVPGRSVVLRIDDIFILIVFFTWLAKLTMNKELGVLRHTALNQPIALYMAILLVSSLFGIVYSMINLLKTFFYLLKYLEYFMLFFMVINNLKDMRQVKRMVFCILLTSLVVSAYAIITLPSFGRATAPFQVEGSEPNTLGGYLVVIMSVSAGLLLYTRRIAFRLFLVGVIAVSLRALTDTYSRGSYLAFVAAFLALTVFTTRKKVILLVLMGVFFVTWRILLPPKAHERITGTFASGTVYQLPTGKSITLDESASARIEMWDRAFKDLKYSPLFGFGVTGGGFMDSQYPLVIEESGLVGLAVFIWLLATMLKEGIRILKESDDDFASGLALGFIVSLVAIVVHGFSAATFIIIRIMEPFWFLAAIVMVLPQITRGRPKEEAG